MSKKSKLRGVKALIHDGVDATVDLVAIGNASSARFVTRITDEFPVLRQPVRAADSIRHVATDGVLSAIKLTNTVVQRTTDAAIDLVHTDVDTHEHAGVGDIAPIALGSDDVGTMEWWGDAAVAVVNAAIGDHLADSKNSLAEPLALRFVTPVKPENVQRIAIFVHGLATTEWSWFLNSEAYYADPSVSFGTRLQDDEGFVPVFVRYNTGRSVDENGADLSDAIEELVDELGDDLGEIIIIGHSMGGLVARAATTSPGSESWRKKVTRIVYLGSPHEGAPLAKVADVIATAFQQVDLPAYQVLGRIINGRSGGLRDLAVGASTKELIPDVEHIFVAATIFDGENAVGNIVGDLLVRVSSAHDGEQDSRRVNLKRYHAGRVLHHQLQNHPVVYEMLLGAIRGEHHSEASD